MVPLLKAIDFDVNEELCDDYEHGYPAPLEDIILWIETSLHVVN